MSEEAVTVPARRGRKPKPPAEAPSRADLAGAPGKPPVVERDKVANRLWDDLTPILVGGRVVGAADVVSLTVLCTAWSRLVRARGILKRAKSWVIEGATGGSKAHPMLAVEQSACRDVASAADKLGLSPTSRARIAYLKDGTSRPLFDPETQQYDEDADLDDILRD